MSQPTGSHLNFVLHQELEWLQVEFINSAQTLTFYFDDWLFHQLEANAEPYDDFNRCPGCGNLLPIYLIHSFTGFCHGCRGDDDLM